ncbi:PqqD family protein [Streptomyces sp. NPDC051909]|uniref:PqqD family protein n=1 Tax=Streptomyces sp. NPDC051909 TaxID=3154944 RepID=UPI00342E64EE
MNDQPTRGARLGDRERYDQLTAFFNDIELTGMAAVGDRLVEALGGPDQLPDRKVMVAYGGGKDSTYVVAFVRAVQLHLQLAHGRTFVMRVANMRHAGVPLAVMENIHRVYEALGLLDDERAELLTVDHTVIRPFRVDLPLPERLVELNRVDVLMNGHRSAGDGRPTFCNSCNLAVADFYGRAAWWQGGVDVIMTGDSRREQALYSAWILRLAKASGIDVDECRRMGFQGLLTALRGIGDAYFRELFGDDVEAEELEARAVSTGDRSMQPEFVSIYDLVSYRVHDHWDLIVDFLGFRFDDLAFSFTESDCANPTLMAHLRGLRAQHVESRDYEAGIVEYLQLAEQMMRKKEMPEDLIRLALSRYDSPAKIAERRELSTVYARDVFGLSEAALTAMVFSPFTDEGARLEAFVAACHPEMAGRTAELRAALRGEPGAEDAAEWLEQVTALSLTHLRTLYRSALVDFGAQATMMSRVRAGDPHKAQVKTVDPATGMPVLELISGR